MSKDLNSRLQDIQGKLKSPKGQMNKFGGYAYRSCEDILESVKPHLSEHELTLIISDEVVMVGERVYVKATVTISDGVDSLVCSAYAREAEVQKGMSDSQITGSASSYARKYALNGLLLIDDTKDADATNDHGKSAPKSNPARSTKVEEKTEAPKRTLSRSSAKVENKEEPKQETKEAPKRGFRRNKSE